MQPIVQQQLISLAHKSSYDLRFHLSKTFAVKTQITLLHFVLDKP